MNNTQLLSMAKLFSTLGYSYETLDEETSIDVRDKRVFIKSFNHSKKEIEYTQILSLIRKKDCSVIELRTKAGDALIRGTKDHQVFITDKDSYVALGEFKTGTVLTSTQQEIEAVTIKTSLVSPILDIEVKDNNNYFSNGILSHNSGGNALKFYASARVETSRVNKPNEEKGKAVSNTHTANVKKNKCAPPFKTAEFDITFGKGISKASELLTILLDAGIIEKSGSWYAQGEERIGQGKAVTTNFIEQNLDHFMSLLEGTKIKEEENEVAGP